MRLTSVAVENPLFQALVDYPRLESFVKDVSIVVHRVGGGCDRNVTFAAGGYGHREFPAGAAGGSGNACCQAHNLLE